jgi:hypothetical protein
MMICSISDCPSTARANGLCQKHYMRARRHGDANTIGKRGPKPDTGLATIRTLFRDLSPRTQARYIRALRLSQFLRDEFGVDLFEQAAAEATRPNGSMSFNGLLQAIELSRAALAWGALLVRAQSDESASGPQ